MIESCKYISLDIEKQGSQASLFVRQWETGRSFAASLTEDGQPIEFGDDVSAVFAARKPDGSGIFNDCRIEGGLVCYKLTAQTTAAPGELECEIRLYDGNNDLIVSPRFEIVVLPAVTVDREIVSGPEASALTGLITDARDAIDRCEASIVSDVTVALNENGGAPGASVSSATENDTRTLNFIFENLKGNKGDTGDRGETGDTGPAGTTGADGFSPSASVEQTATGAIVTVTDRNGTTTAEIKNGDARINDEAINTTETLSSKKSADLFGYPLSLSGAVVQDNFIPNYPLEAISHMEPKQEGSGDPSPTNVRNIVPYTQAKLTRCGENICHDEYIGNPKKKRWDILEVPPDCLPSGRKITLSFDTPNTGISVEVRTESGISAPSFVLDGTKKVITAIVGTPIVGSDGKCIVLSRETETSEVATGLISNVQIELADDATTYEPYNGNTYTATFGQDVYGGELNWKTRKLETTWKHKIADENSRWEIENGRVFVIYGFVQDSKGIRRGDYFKCDRLPWNNTYSGAEGFNFAPPNSCTNLVLTIEFSQKFKNDDGSLSLDKLKVWLHDNPLDIAYEVANPTENTISVSGSPTALPGKTTVYSDTGDTTVNGVGDMAAYVDKKFAELNSALISLGGNV
ncbi:MAG: BppU family phage baseplate upper protein [Candidatus Limivicinus sp.]|jgi:hypothetical protein